MCPDTINSFTLKLNDNNPYYNMILACQDHYIRVLNGNRLYYQIKTNSAVTCIDTYFGEVYNGDVEQEIRKNKTIKQIVYGNEHGDIGIYLYVLLVI